MLLEHSHRLTGSSFVASAKLIWPVVPGVDARLSDGMLTEDELSLLKLDYVYRQVLLKAGV